MRNMIEVNKKAFSNLIEQFIQRQQLPVEEGKRFIATDEEEKNWIKIATNPDVLYVTPNLRLVQIEFKESVYLGVVGAILDINEFDNSVISEVKLNAGILTLLISQGYVQLDKKANLLEFYNNILFQHEDDRYQGHDYNDLLPFLEQFHLFEVPESSILKSDIISRFSCYVFAKNPLQLVLDFNKNVVDTISELSLVGSDNISYKILLTCLFSTTYKHAFLELYRLIERLFPVNYLKEFHTKTGTKLSFLEFSAALEEITSWRPKEDDAIEKMFENIKPTTKKYFEDFHKSSETLQDVKGSKYFYSLRNSIVHFRANHSDHELNKEQWNLLIMATLFLLDEQYSQHYEVLNR